MNISKLLTIFVISTISTLALAASKSDLAKEKRWEEQIVDSLMVGEEARLKAGGVEFLGLYAEPTTEKAVGGMIIIHGIGVHPAWPEVIEPLRINMPDYGWHTLSIQMPILANEADEKEYIALIDEVPGRIQAAVDFLKSKGVQNIVIVSHSLGTSMTNYYLTNKPDSTVRAYVAIGMNQFTHDDRMNAFKTLPNIKIPVLDIYGGQDLEHIVKFADKRKRAGSKNKNYSQVKIEGANHFFNNMDDVLVKRVRGWLAKMAPGTEIKK